MKASLHNDIKDFHYKHLVSMMTREYGQRLGLFLANRIKKMDVAGFWIRRLYSKAMKQMTLYIGLGSIMGINLRKVF